MFELAKVVGVFTDALTEPTIGHIVGQTVLLLELGGRPGKGNCLPNGNKYEITYQPKNCEKS